MTFRKNDKWAKATKRQGRGWVVALGWSGNLKCSKIYEFGNNRALAAAYVVSWLNR